MIKDYGFMTEETSINIIKKALEVADGGHVTFAFQGGEPSLIGLDFFERFVESVNLNNIKNSKINYAIQTNGILINDEWAAFFHKHKFLVGLSLDGPKDIHNINRIDKKANGTYKSVMQAVKYLDKHNVSYNLLTVVTSLVSRKIDKVYNFFKTNGFKYLQFIPCIDSFDTDDQAKYSLSPEQYKNFLCKLFDKWYLDMKKGEVISIRYFDNILSMFLGMAPESCDMIGHCSIQHVIEADGSIYPCDFYVLDEVKLGNINSDNINDIHQGAIVKSFIEESLNVDTNCKKCEWYKLCRGGCKRLRHIEDDGTYGLNKFCDSYKSFYEYSYERFEVLAGIIRKNRF